MNQQLEPRDQGIKQYTEHKRTTYLVTLLRLFSCDNGRHKVDNERLQNTNDNHDHLKIHIFPNYYFSPRIKISIRAYRFQISAFATEIPFRLQKVFIFNYSQGETRLLWTLLKSEYNSTLIILFTYLFIDNVFQLNWGVFLFFFFTWSYFEFKLLHVHYDY